MADSTDRAVLDRSRDTDRATVGRPSERATSKRRRALFEEAVSVIERRYHDERLTVSGLSKDVFASRRQLQRSFAEAGTSVRERLHAVRMERAAELLRESSLPVAEIGRSVGYRQPAQFAKAFRRYYAAAPAQWRSSVDSNPAIGEVIAMECRCGCGAAAASTSSELGSRPEREASSAAA